MEDILTKKKKNRTCQKKAAKKLDISVHNNQHTEVVGSSSNSSSDFS